MPGHEIRETIVSDDAGVWFAAGGDLLRGVFVPAEKAKQNGQDDQVSEQSAQHGERYKTAKVHGGRELAGSQYGESHDERDGGKDHCQTNRPVRRLNGFAAGSAQATSALERKNVVNRTVDGQSQ